MIPILNLIGKKNVGKTTIFNKLSKYNKFYLKNYFNSKQCSLCEIKKKWYLLIDELSLENLKKIEYNLNIICNYSDIILFIINTDFNDFYINLIISNYLKKINKYVFLLINKIDNNKLYFNINFYNLGLGKPFLISALHNFNLLKSINIIINIYCFNKNCLKKEYKFKNISLFILGSNNSGKNNFLFSLIKNKNIFLFKQFNFYISYKNIYYKLNIFFNLFKKINKKKNFKNILEILINSNLILYFINPLNNLNNLDFKFYKLISNNFLNLIFIINKSDILNLYEKIFFKKFFKKKIKIKNYYILFLSSLLNINLIYFKLFIKKIYYLSIININTNKLNKIIFNFSKFLKIYYNYKTKINYVHQGGKNPILIIIHSKKKINICYKKFLEKIFIKKLDIKGVSLKIKF